jgi:transcriptional regulator with XRE-family HTH domain
MGIGKQIKWFRKKKGLTQVSLAQKAGISRSYLADVEGDRYNPSVETLKSIAQSLGIPAGWLIDGQGPEAIECSEDKGQKKCDQLKHVQRLTAGIKHTKQYRNIIRHLGGMAEVLNTTPGLSKETKDNIYFYLDLALVETMSLFAAACNVEWSVTDKEIILGKRPTWCQGS